jgi:hypothetical protein
VRIGDTLRLTGTGMCNIHTPGSWSAKEDSPFLPFDCSQIVWNDAPPLPLPESDIVSKATALMQTVQRQLHPKPTMIPASARRCVPPFRNQAWCCWMIWRYRPENQRSLLGKG